MVSGLKTGQVRGNRAAGAAAGRVLVHSTVASSMVGFIREGLNVFYLFSLVFLCVCVSVNVKPPTVAY